MDSSETLIKKHLELRGFSRIVFEPDGNIPPDFLVEDRIAIEVRRLNQGLKSGDKIEGLEESAYPLYGKIGSLLKTLGPPRSEISWFVLHHFTRPIPPWRELKRSIISCCERIAESAHLSPSTHIEVRVHDNFELTFLRATEPFESMFITGGYSDYDSGGFVLAEMEKNLQYWIAEKTRKISVHRHKYSEWWLALVDHIGLGLSNEDQETFKRTFSIKHSWDRILIVSPLNPTKYFEI